MVTSKKAAAAAADPDRERRLLELQQTLAQTQRTLAEALLALSGGLSTTAGRSVVAVEETAVFVHSGTLRIDDDGKLYLDEGKGVGDRSLMLERLADDGKRLQVEFDLGAVQEPGAGGARGASDLVSTLSDFLCNRALTLRVTRATCIPGTTTVIV